MLRRSLVSLLPLIGAVLSGRHGEIDNRDIAAGQNDTFYDYIVVGAGPTGIIAADRLSETGKKVLLIERGGPSTAATGGTDVAPWANSTRLTRFDIPGLYEAMYQGDNQYWWCDDMDVHTGCVIGGNSAINGMLYWYPTDFEYSTSNGWPSGWQSVSTYLDKLKARLPSTDNPSRDGKYYLGQVHDVIGSILQKQGYTGIIGNDQRNNKDHVYTHTNYFIQNQTRTGPMDTYLQSARARPNFTLLSRTSVVSVVRNGSHITGVQTNDTTGGSSGIINVTPATGRVVLAAGAFGTAKILFQSGIGPTDMLSLAAKNSTVSQYMPPSSQYINLPVGINVTDNPSVRVVFTHPSVDSYNSWSNMYTNPRPADAAQYVSDRSGPLSGPSARANFWRAYNATDGRTRYVQGTCRPGGSLPGGSTYNISNVFFCTIYVSTGLTSVGRIGIDSSLRGVVLQEPYFTDPADKDVLVSGVSDFLSTYQQVPDLQLALPNSSTSISAHVDSTASGSSHWVGSTRIGTDSWTSVVDSNTKVWFTDNLFVVDAGIYPGVATGNPVGSLMVMAEMAADKIRGSTGGGGSSSLGNNAGSSLHNGLFFGYIVSLVVMYCMMYLG